MGTTKPMDLRDTHPTGKAAAAGVWQAGARTLRTGRWADRLVGAVERSRTLDRLAKRLGYAFTSVVRPGLFKDALSGTWMAHPAHPMLTDVAIGAWTNASLLDALGRTEGADALVGAGVLAAVPTALTGLSDLADVEEPQARAAGAAHAIGNVAALSFYAASWFLRRRGARKAGITTSLIGAGIATGAGFLGGHLAFRRGVGVDNTVFDDPVADWTKALDVSDVPEGKLVRARLQRTDVLLWRNGDTISAIASRCSHRGGPLHKGKVEDGTVTCPWHRSRFRLDDGSVVNGPATAPQPCFEARVRDGSVEVRARH